MCNNHHLKRIHRARVQFILELVFPGSEVRVQENVGSRDQRVRFYLKTDFEQSYTTTEGWILGRLISRDGGVSKKLTERVEGASAQRTRIVANQAIASIRW